MNSFSHPFPDRLTRIGFHYYPDTLHYRESDLQTTLPEMESMGASWIVLKSGIDRAIPEDFLQSLVKKGIEPLIQFDFPIGRPPTPGECSTVFEAYARWGVHGVLLFDRPNAHSSYPAAGWAQQDLVERFVDSMLPLSLSALQSGLIPIFPPLEPGGSYWDTAFLRAALDSLERRKQNLLLQNLALSAYSWTGGHPLNWGAGGPERWPESHAYSTQADSQDQRGFRIFDWYQSIARSVLGHNVPIILLQAGVDRDPLDGAVETINLSVHPDVATGIIKLLCGKAINDPLAPQGVMDAIPPEVLAANFWLLADEPHSPFYRQAWLGAGGQFEKTILEVKRTVEELVDDPAAKIQVDPDHPLKHYLLVPTYDWGVADWHLEVIRPFVKKYRPVIGFSLEEASLAREVTVIGNTHSFSDDQLNHLRNTGCKVRRISGDGTSIASQLTER